MVFEWSILFYISIILISILLPDLFVIGRSVFYTHQAASMGIQQAVTQGQMESAEFSVPDNVNEYLESRNIYVAGIWGTEGQVAAPGMIELIVQTAIQPRILQLMPDMRLSQTLALEEGIIRITVQKVDVSSVYFRN